MPYSIILPKTARAVSLSKVAKMELLNARDDIAWVRKAHVPSLPLDTGSVVVIGDEDSPDGFMVYNAHDPLVSDNPVIYARDLDWGFMTLRFCDQGRTAHLLAENGSPMCGAKHYASGSPQADIHDNQKCRSCIRIEAKRARGTS
jgi:hypothetical protein